MQQVHCIQLPYSSLLFLGSATDGGEQPIEKNLQRARIKNVNKCKWRAHLNGTVTRSHGVYRFEMRGLLIVFKWMIPVSKNLENKHCCIEKADIAVIADKNLKVNLTPACQFFAYSSYLLQTDVYISIPTPNKEAEKLVLEQLTPHYKRIIKASIGNQACQYNLIGLKPETIALFQKYENTDKLCSILPDIVRSNHIKQLDEKYFEDANIKEFAIDMDVLKPLNLPETESVYQFLKQTFLQQQDICRHSLLVGSCKAI